MTSRAPRSAAPPENSLPGSEAAREDRPDGDQTPPAPEDGRKARTSLRELDLEPLLIGGAGAAGVTRVDGAFGLDEQDVGFLVGFRAVLYAARDDVELPGAELDVAVAELDRETAAEDQEEVVGLVVLVPYELAEDLDHGSL